MSEEEMLNIIDRIIRYNSLTYFGYNTVQVGYEALEKIIKQYKILQKENKDLEGDRDYYKEMYYKIAFPEEEIHIKGLGVD